MSYCAHIEGVTCSACRPRKMMTPEEAKEWIKSPEATQLFRENKAKAEREIKRVMTSQVMPDSLERRVRSLEKQVAELKEIVRQSTR